MYHPLSQCCFLGWFHKVAVIPEDSVGVRGWKEINMIPCPQDKLYSVTQEPSPRTVNAAACGTKAPVFCAAEDSVF